MSERLIAARRKAHRAQIEVEDLVRERSEMDERIYQARVRSNRAEEAVQIIEDEEAEEILAREEERFS